MAGISDLYGTGVIENTQDETGVGNATLTVNNATDCAFGGILRNAWQGSGNLALVKEGPGTLTLVGPMSSAYTGGTDRRRRNATIRRWRHQRLFAGQRHQQRHHYLQYRPLHK